jgi:hypothetical protein
MTKDAIEDSDGFINRINVVVSDLEVFVASENPRSPKFNVPYFFNISSDIKHDALVFENTATNKASVSEVPLPMLTRRWQRISMNPFELKLMIDYAPHLRLCIMDTLDSEHDVCFEMKMSQLYALLSLWYCNMQELPRVSFLYHENLTCYGTFSFILHCIKDVPIQQRMHRIWC